eukprot:127623-Pelagomonas_calceolata.AAC.1
MKLNGHIMRCSFQSRHDGAAYRQLFTLTKPTSPSPSQQGRLSQVTLLQAMLTMQCGMWHFKQSFHCLEEPQRCMHFHEKQGWH